MVIVVEPTVNHLHGASHGLSPMLILLEASQVSAGHTLLQEAGWRIGCTAAIANEEVSASNSAGLWPHPPSFSAFLYHEMSAGYRRKTWLLL
jgi:hypothetical protein